MKKKKKKTYTKKFKIEQAERILGHDKSCELARYLLYLTDNSIEFSWMREYIDFEYIRKSLSSKEL